MKRASVFLTVISVLVLTAILSAGNIAVFLFSKAYGLDIKYKNVKMNAAPGVSFRGFEARDRKTGLGLFSDTADVRVLFSRGFFKDVAFKLDFEGGSFLRTAANGAEDYADLNDLVALPFKSAWKYRKISAVLRPIKDGTAIDELYAESDMIKLSVEGELRANNDISLRIKIYFGKELTGKIPEAMSRVVLQEEGSGWKSLSVSLNGNYEKPSIQVSSKLFRLSIKSVSEGTTAA